VNRHLSAATAAGDLDDVADGARVVDAPTMVSGDWQLFVPDTAPGEVAASPRNPVVTRPSSDGHIGVVDSSATHDGVGRP
jgi:hypothetical protein